MGRHASLHREDDVDLQQAFDVLCQLDPVCLEAPTAQHEYVWIEVDLPTLFFYQQELGGGPCGTVHLSAEQ